MVGEDIRGDRVTLREFDVSVVTNPTAALSIAPVNVPASAPAFNGPATGPESAPPPPPKTIILGLGLQRLATGGCPRRCTALQAAFALAGANPC